jgi:anti-sigma-K factor RskA
MTPDPRRARLEELLGAEATQGLSPAETAELDTLLAAFPDEDPDGFELAAAAVHLAVLGAPEEMPSRLAEKLHLAAVAVTPASALRPPRRAGRPAWVAWSGWVIAAGLAGVLIYTQWPKKPIDSGPLVGKPFSGEGAGATASVTWDEAKQQGEFRVSGLKPNDPAKEQYQLWVMDAAHKEAIPVVAGVFDVKPDGTATLAVRSPIRVSDAQAFAVSKEKPGGGPQPTMTQVVLVMKPKA